MSINNPPEITKEQPVTRPISSMIIGLIVFLAALVAWIYASEHNIDPSPLWVFTVPIITALFIGNQLGKAADSASAAAAQTNGVLDARIRASVTQVFNEQLPQIEAATSSSLAKRDQSRTYQDKLTRKEIDNAE